MPARFDIGCLQPQHTPGQFTLLLMGHVNDPALRINPPQPHRERPGEHEITQPAGLENENVSAEHLCASLSRFTIKAQSVCGLVAPECAERALKYSIIKISCELAGIYIPSLASISYEIIS